MMSEWQTVVLGDIATLRNGYAFKSSDFVEHGVPIIKIKNVKPNRINLDNLSYVSEEVAESTAKHEIQSDEILLTMSGNRAAREQAIDESESRNRERRKRKLRERRENAPTKESVKKLRSVPSHSRSEIDRQALFDFYFDEEEESVFCQICLDAMPFIKRNGEVCGECVDLLTEKWADTQGFKLKVMTALNLVLCPVCSEIYRDYVHKDLGKQTELFDHLTNGRESDFVVCDFDVRRDQKGCVLHINETHLGDIRDCLQDDDADD